MALCVKPVVVGRQFVALRTWGRRIVLGDDKSIRASMRKSGGACARFVAAGSRGHVVAYTDILHET